MQLQAEDLLILSGIKIAPTQAELKQINELIPQIKDWNYFTKTAIEHQAGPLLYKKLPLLSNSNMIPEAVQGNFKQAWLKTLSRSMVLIEHFKKISEAFKSEQLPVIAMKGILLSDWLYREIGLRQFSDMDLLVKEEDSEKCLDILREMGYQSSEYTQSKFVKENTETVHFPPMIKNGVSIEIHIKIHRNSEPYHVNVAELWEKAIPVTIHGVDTMAFNINDLLLHLCLHLDKHFCNGKIQFTCFYDIANLLEQHAAKIDWDQFKNICIRYNAIKQTYPYILLTAKYMNAPIPESVRKEFGSLLSANKEFLLLKFMKCKMSVNYASSVLRSIKRFNNPLKGLRYLFEMIFPQKKFMVKRYKIKNPSLFFLYYPIRIGVGIRTMGSSFLNRFH